MDRRTFIAGFGGAAAWPAAVWGQQPALPVVGYLNGGPAGPWPVVAAFESGLRDKGYVSGRNIELLYRWADTRYDRLPSLAADLVVRSQRREAGGPTGHAASKL